MRKSSALTEALACAKQVNLRPSGPPPLRVMLPPEKTPPLT